MLLEPLERYELLEPLERYELAPWCTLLLELREELLLEDEPTREAAEPPRLLLPLTTREERWAVELLELKLPLELETEELEAFMPGREPRLPPLFT